MATVDAEPDSSDRHRRCRGVLFDVDGTLYEPGLLRGIVGLHLAASFLAHPVRTYRDLHAILSYRKAQEDLRDGQPGKMDPDAQLLVASRTSGIPPEQLRDSIGRWMERLPLRFLNLCTRRDLAYLIRTWDSLGVPMGVYSDYPAAEKLRALGIASHFRAAMCSTDDMIGRLKPATDGFLAGAEALGLPVQNVAYIGDRGNVDGKGATDAGMAFIDCGKGSPLLRPAGRSSAQLRSLDAALQDHYAPADAPCCWVCGSRESRLAKRSTVEGPVEANSMRITDSTYGQTASLQKCARCGFVFAHPLPHARLVELYENMDDPAYEETAAGRQLQMRRLLERAIELHPAAKSLLDVGAGTGLLVAEARDQGLQAEGVEPSRWCVETAARTRDVHLHQGTLEDHADQLGRYDLVMLVDIVEHVDSPMTLLRGAMKVLAPGGRIVIVTPDVSSPLARMMGRRWWHYRLAHVGYFDKASTLHALKLAGLRAVDVEYVGWRFPLAYLLERLQRYLPIPPFSTLLRKAATSSWAQQHEINLNLYDSRMFVAARIGDDT